MITYAIYRKWPKVYSDKNRQRRRRKTVSDELSEWEMERKSNLKDELEILIALIWNSLHLLYFTYIYHLAFHFIRREFHADDDDDDGGGGGTDYYYDYFHFLFFVSHFWHNLNFSLCKIFVN